MNGSKHVVTNDTLIQHDSILIVVTLPWHVSYKEVTSECQLSILCCITLCQDISLLDTLSLVTNRTQVDGHVLVCTTELRNTVLLKSRFEADELLVLCSIIEDTDCRCVNIFYNKKGISPAAIEAICCGDTSIKSTSAGGTTGKSAS